MPTARELLEQADALMRRNRKRGKARFGDASTLTDVLGARDATVAPTVILPQTPPAEVAPIALDAAGAPAAPPSPAGPQDDDPISLETLSDVPVLTDVVVRGSTIAGAFAFLVTGGDDDADDVEASAGARAARSGGATETTDAARASAAAHAPGGDAFPTSAAQAAAAAAQLPPPAVLEQEGAAPPVQDEPAPAAGTPAPATSDDEFILDIPPASEPPRGPVQDPPIPAVAPPALPPVGGGWDALAEEIRMQVLQRLDLFTDTGMRDQLGARLQPIVDRASAQLVATINRELGELVRGYVAEAIEREIESWRTRES